MDFLQRLKEHMEGLENTPSVIDIGSYNEDGDSIGIRPAPNSISNRYISGKIYPFSFQVLVHHKNNMTAYTTLQEILKVYDHKHVTIPSNDGSYILISIENTTLPNYVETTNYGTLWTAIFNAELYIK